MRGGILAAADEFSCEFEENETQEACRSGQRAAENGGGGGGLIKAKAVHEVDADRGRATQACREMWGNWALTGKPARTKRQYPEEDSTIDYLKIRTSLFMMM